MLVAAGGGILHGKGQISLAAAVVAPGLMVMAIILFMGAVSGAHLNPAVSLAFALRGDFPWKRVPGYIVIQLVGATLACLFLLAVFGNVQHLGATLPGPGYEDWQALLMEIVLTAVLVSVILGTASAAQNVGAIAALGVGGYIALAGLWSAPVSGTSMNPARSFGPALVSGDFTSYWVYVVGPARRRAHRGRLRDPPAGRGGNAISHAAGSGVLDEGSRARVAGSGVSRPRSRVRTRVVLARAAVLGSRSAGLASVPVRRRGRLTGSQLAHEHVGGGANAVGSQVGRGGAEGDKPTVGRHRRLSRLSVAVRALAPGGAADERGGRSRPISDQHVRGVIRVVGCQRGRVGLKGDEASIRRRRGTLDDVAIAVAVARCAGGAAGLARQGCGGGCEIADKHVVIRRGVEAVRDQVGGRGLEGNDAPVG